MSDPFHHQTDEAGRRERPHGTLREAERFFLAEESLLIPLSTPDDSEMSIRGLLSPPDIQHLEAELIREPPSINLAYRRNYLFPRRGETYSRQLDWQPFRVPRNDVFFYYQIDGVRGVPGYDDDRPFLRSILGKQYPEPLRPRTS